MTARRRKLNVLIAGLGNYLLQDDGVGIHAIHKLQEAPPRGVQVVEVGTAVLDALHLFEWADVVLAIDAMQAGGPAGAIYRFGIDDVASSEVSASLHELSLKAVFNFLPEDKRPQMAILGVEPGIIDYGLELSPPVAAALPPLVAAVREIVAQWVTQPATGEQSPKGNRVCLEV